MIGSSRSILEVSGITTPSTSTKKNGLPIRFQNISINASAGGGGEGDSLVETLGSKILDTFVVPKWILNPVLGRKKGKIDENVVISGVDGIVEQGELLFIIGPPASNSSLLLRALSIPSDLPINGHLDYGLLPQTSFQTRFRLPFSTSSTTPVVISLRSEVIYLNSNDDIFFAHLSLRKSLLPLSLSKTPSRNSQKLEGVTREAYASSRLDEILEKLGLSHDMDTKVGSSTVIGLSGGERRRASIAEALLSDPCCVMLDNPMNGLDSSTALRVMNYLKEFAVQGKRSVVVTAPHLADNLFAAFDKVLVLNSSGQEVFYGRRDKVASYFEGLGLGFKRRIVEGEGVAEFVVNCIEGRGNDRELKKSWDSSEEKKILQKEISDYGTRLPYPTFPQYKISFLSSVRILIKRQYDIIFAELPTYTTKTVVNLLLSVLVGSVFFRLPSTTEGAFTRASLLLLSIMFNAYLSLAELGKALEGREIVKRHGDFGFYSASALALARVAGDLPLILVQVLLFGTITYFFAGLQPSFEKFAIYITFVYATALCLSSMFRMFAAFSANFDTAIRSCGISLNILVVYSGYFVPTISMTPWLQWIHYIIDPISRSYEAVLANEFHHLNLTCSPNDIVPYGSTYINPLYQTCLLPGSTPGQLSVSGDAYLSTAYDFHYSNIWFNLGIMVLQSIVFLVVGILASDYLIFTSEGSKRIWNRTEKVKARMQRLEKSSVKVDEEGESGKLLDAEVDEEVGDYSDGVELKVEGSTLTFKDISLWVDTQFDTRRLLDRISGYVKPGMLVALCGGTGTGKSTLLNVLAGRSEGVVKGAILVDGKAPTSEFYRSTGYVRQNDIFDDRSTVREALEFSTFLRQDARTSREDKIKYVNFVLEVLSLTHLQDAIIGSPSSGINMEYRKRLSIGVEVVSRPTILFCDEPTSGLSTKSASRIVKLLRRLSDLGIAVIATIHQPSAETFAIFDTLLLLKKGGKQIYFGPRENSIDFFTSTPLEPSTNPAEFLLDISTTGNKADDEEEYLSSGVEVDTFASKWKTSNEAQLLQETLLEISKVQTIKSDAFVSPSLLYQCTALTKRVSKNFYRDASYSYTKIFASTVVSLIIGLTFFQQGNTIVSFQNRLFSVFLILFLPPVLMNGSIFKIFLLRGLFDAREGPSKIYGKFAFVTSLLLSELPYSIISATIYFVIFYFLVGLPLSYETISFTFALVQLFFFFISTWSLWITALSSNLGTIANLLPFFLVSCEVFNGALMPYSLMPHLWKALYWISPFQYYVRAMLGSILHGISVQCSPSELVSFSPPPGLNCLNYSKTYLLSHTGYLVNESSTEICQYCRFSTGDDYLATLNIDFEGRWIAFFVFSMFCISNVLLVYFFTFFPPRLPSIFKSGTTSQLEKIAADTHSMETLEGARILQASQGGAFE